MRASLLFAAIVLATSPLLCPDRAQAQAIRTWVSGVGDDANLCSRTAPCKTFAGAISKTAADGIINCIDPGGFGAVTITKSITIDCTGTTAGILAAGTNGINVNGTNVVVTLRGLSIEGAGTGLIGVNFIEGSVLQIDRCKIFGFRAGTATGIRFAPNGSAKLFVTDTISSNNQSGVVIDPGAAGAAVAVIQRVSVQANAEGLRATGVGGGTVSVSIRETVASHNVSQGFTAVTIPGGAGVMMVIDRSASILNAMDGVRVNGAGANVVIGASTVTGNATGLNSFNGGAIFSYQDNSVTGNTTNGAPTSVVNPM